MLGSQDLEVSTTARRIRVFKQEIKTVPLLVNSRSWKHVELTLLSIQGGTCIDGELRRLDEGQLELLLKSLYAGRSEGLFVMFQITDPLGLLSKQIPVHLDLTFESLPLALRGVGLSPPVYPISYGEIPVGRKGPGLELYGVTRYQPGLDPRDIMWKKAASMADESLPLREREANVRNISITVAVDERSGANGAIRADLVAESIARVGRQFLLAGSSVEINRPKTHSQKSIKVLVSSIRELADAVLIPWTAGPSPELRSIKGMSSDLLIIGSEGLDWVTPASKRFKQILLISDSISPSATHGNISVFSGKEDLANLATSVLIE